MKRLIALMALVIPLTCSVLSAQETETEKAAARDVPCRMELMNLELVAMADDIATHPEIGFTETRSIGNHTYEMNDENLSRSDTRASRSTPRR